MDSKNGGNYSIAHPVLYFFYGRRTWYIYSWHVVVSVATSNIIWQDALSLPLLILSLFQFTIYGFIIDKSQNKSWATILIILVHLISAFVIIYLRRPEWN
jgi:hypothetical protein